ncbi:TPA: hypothetical protein ACH3X2_002246 [Trebouxia sp. C0005]
MLSINLMCPRTAECCLDGFTACTALMHNTERLPCANQATSAATRSSLQKAGKSLGLSVDLASASRRQRPRTCCAIAMLALKPMNNLPLGYAAAIQVVDILLLQLWSFGYPAPAPARWRSTATLTADSHSCCLCPWLHLTMGCTTVSASAAGD